MLDPGEGDINARAHAPARPHVTVDHPASLRDPARARAERCHLREGCFVGGRLTAIEDPRASGEAGAGADGDEVVERRVHRAQEIELGFQVW